MVTDAAARQQALDPALSFIVQAPAGSGKTALLVYRILTALATVEKPEQVLAITFTRKATAEMRERVISLLRQAEAGVQLDDAFEQQGINLATAVLQQDQKHSWRLLDAPDQLQIHTIDAFCARLTGDMPWLSRLGNKPATTDDAHHLYAAAVDALLNSLLDQKQDETHQALQTVLLELDFDYQRARRLFAAMLGKRDQWLRHLVQNDLPALRESLETTWQTLQNETVDKLNTLIPQSTLALLVGLANESAKLIPSGKQQLDAFTQMPLLPGAAITFHHWRDLQYLVTTSKLESFRKRVDVNIGFPPDQKDRKKVMREVLATFDDDELLLHELRNLDALPDAGYSETDWQQLLALEKVLLRLAALLQLEFRNGNECDHSEVAQRALRALAELDSPTDLALRIDYRLAHILVDEFQDTSRSQLELLRQLTAGWQADDGRSLFLVGDPMQSIYRFREADVSLFLQVANNNNTHVFDNLKIHPLRLSENFRSRSDLVSWFNAVFAMSFPQQGDVLSGAISYAESTSNKQAEGEVSAQLVHDSEQEANHVLEHVRGCLQRDNFSKVAILVRSRAHLIDIIKALEADSIPYTGVDIKPLIEVAAVQDLLTLCKAICRPHDRLVWMALLRSPLLGLSLNELMGLGRDDLWLALQKNSFEGDTQQRLERFNPVMAKALSQRQQVPLHTITRWAWQALGGESLQEGVSDNDIERLLKIIEQQEVGGDLTSLTELDNALAGLYAQPSEQAGERVVLSTMHKAKGLQYDTVVLPGLDRQPPSADKNVLMWAETNDHNGNSQLLLAPIRMQTDAGQHFDYLRRLESERASQERVRLMYVACTRAERKIVLLARHTYDKDDQLKAPTKSSLLGTVWTATQSQFSIALKPDSGAEQAALDQTLSRLPANFKPKFGAEIAWRNEKPAAAKEQESDVLEFEWATELATGVGLALHSWLELNSDRLFSASVDDHQRRQWRAELQSLRVPTNRLAAGVQRLEKAILKMQHDPNAKFVFDQHIDAANELALTRFNAGKLESFKIDRTFVDKENVRWVVDYKTTATQQADIAAFVDAQVAERHKPQLENYGHLLHEFDSRPIMLAVYFPLLGELRSWPFQPQPSTLD